MNHFSLTRVALFVTVTAVLLLPCADAIAQSSSLYVEKNRPTRATRTEPSKWSNQRRDGVIDRLSPAIAEVSLSAATLPEQRKFAVNDLVTIIVRESTESKANAFLETEKTTEIDGGIDAIPKVDLSNLNLGAANFSRGNPRVGLDMSKGFEGDGSFGRKDTFTTRLTARVIDVKPNGLLVLEARKHMRTDKETLSLVITGTCRSLDVAGDNSVLSTNLAGLRVAKEHEGEVKRATKKGILTQIFEGIFAF